jgi:hypothetical protein
MGGRAERNEHLLLHEFHARKFIVPDKAVYGKAAAKDDDDDDEDAAPGAGAKVDPPPTYTFKPDRLTRAVLDAVRKVSGTAVVWIEVGRSCTGTGHFWSDG